ncbi:MAG: lysozyme [Bacteroidota bacterium]|nr:lysozyme [Bacteroidota bacterium]
MKTSPAGIELIKKFEGLSLVPYKCPGNVLTIGYGHTKTTKPGMKIQVKEADDLLKEDLKYFEEALLKLIKSPITQNQFDAIVCFCFNVGVGNFKRSTLLKFINSPRYYDAADQFLVWNKVGKKESLGLTNRRTAERNLFLGL